MSSIIGADQRLGDLVFSSADRLIVELGLISSLIWHVIGMIMVCLQENDMI